MKRLLTNLRDQPVELYVGDKVTVLGPRETIEVDESDAGAPQIQVLVRQRLVAVREAAEAAAADKTAERTAEKTAESAAEKTAESAAEKTAESKAKKKAARGPQTNVKGDE